MLASGVRGRLEQNMVKDAVRGRQLDSLRGFTGQWVRIPASCYQNGGV